MTDLKQIHGALTRDSNANVSWAFALAVQSFTRWPVDAYAVEADERGRLHTVCWIQGNTLGKLTAAGDDESPVITGAVQAISNIGAVQVAATVTDDDFGPGRARRAVTVALDGGEEIKVDVAKLRGQHLRERANEFIDALLSAVSRTRTS